MQTITTDNFEAEVLNSDKPVLLEFYSDSCVPCKRMSPILAEVAESYDNIKVVKLNVNFGVDIAGRYNVMSSPTFLFFKKGAELKRLSGVVGMAELEQAIEEVLL